MYTVCSRPGPLAGKLPGQQGFTRDEVGQIVDVEHVTAGEHPRHAGFHGARYPRTAGVHLVEPDAQLARQLVLGNQADRDEQGVAIDFPCAFHDRRHVLVHRGHGDPLHAVAAFDVHDRRRQMQRNAEVVQTLHHVASEPVRVRHDLEHADDFATLQDEPPRHDQPDVPRTQDGDALSRKTSHHVDELLRKAGGEHARRPSAGNVDRAARALAATHRQNHRPGLDGEDATLLVHHPNRFATARVDAHAGHVTVGDQVDVLIDGLRQKPLGVLRPGELFAKVVEPEAGMDALEQDAADLRLAVEDQDPLRARVARAECRAHSGRPAADHDHVVFALCAS